MQRVDVLLTPIVSEKAVRVANLNQYLFEVHPDASKGEIAKAIERHYGVDVVHVQTVSYRLAPRRQTRKRIENTGKPKKKAYVSLKPGQTLNLLEVGE